MARTKKCKRCEKDLPVEVFNRHGIAADGLQTWCRMCKAAYAREWRKANPGGETPARNRWQAKNPEKTRAHRAVRSAVRSGRLTPPEACADCGESKPLQAHHEDYAKLLDVEWLCSLCHNARHPKPMARAA